MKEWYDKWPQVTVAMPLTPGSTTVQNKFLLPQVAFITEMSDEYNGLTQCKCLEEHMPH